VLKSDMEQLVQNLQREAKKMFESDEYLRQRQEMIEQTQRKQQQMMEGLMEEANLNGLALR
jgi:AAA domain